MKKGVFNNCGSIEEEARIHAEQMVKWLGIEEARRLVMSERAKNPGSNIEWHNALWAALA